MVARQISSGRCLRQVSCRLSLYYVLVSCNGFGQGEREGGRENGEEEEEEKDVGEEEEEEQEEE